MSQGDNIQTKLLHLDRCWLVYIKYTKKQIGFKIDADGVMVKTGAKKIFFVDNPLRSLYIARTFDEDTGSYMDFPVSLGYDQQC